MSDYECSAEKFFACWIKNYTENVTMLKNRRTDELYIACFAFTYDPETFRTMRADGFCHCDGKC